MPVKRNNPRGSQTRRPVPEAHALGRARHRSRKPVTVSNVEEMPRSRSHARSCSAGRAGAHSALVDARRKRTRRRSFALIAGIAAVVVLAACAVGAFTFFRSTDSNLDLDQSNAKEALVAQKDGEAYYVLMQADLSQADHAEQLPNAWGYELLRIDEASKTVSMVTIPARLNVRASDGSTRPLDEVHEVDGDAETIRCVADLADVDISHFVTTDAPGIKGIVDAMGGVAMDLESDVDDPRAGWEVVPASAERLNGDQALILLRATNVAGGLDAAFKNRMGFTLCLAEDAADSEGLDFANAVGEASRYIYTDWSASDLLALGGALKPFSDLTIYQCIVPYAASNAQGVDVVLYERQSKSWAAMLERLKAGEDPNAIDSAAESVVPADVTVEVRNGTNTAGAAARLGEMLEGLGYQVLGVGNTDDGTIYPETLIVYTNSASEGAAKAVVADMGSGRVVNGGDFYSSEADIIAIIGQDWMPVD